MTNTRKARKVRCIETGEVYKSVREAGRAIGADVSLISKVVSGMLQSAKGFHFEAVEENFSGNTVTRSVWLIRASCFSSRPLKSCRLSTLR